MALKKIHIFSIMLFLLLVLTSCADSTITNEIKETGVRTGGIQHGVVIPDPETSKFTFEYTGKPIELTYMLENGDIPDNWGLYIFTNGIQQPFTIDHDKDLKKVYIHNFAPKEKKLINIRFNPVSGDIGDSVQVVFIVMLDPNYVLDRKSNIHQYGNNHAITQMPWKIDFKSKNYNNINSKILEKGTKLDIPIDYKKRYEEVDVNGNVDSVLDSSICFEFFNKSYYESEIYVGNKIDIDFTINGAGSYNGYEKIKYRLSIYANHKILNAFYGEKYVDIEIQKGKVTNLKVKIPYGDLIDNDFIYLMAVPLSDDNTTINFIPVQKTESIPLTKE